jgi:hypothetical protein
MDSGSWITAAGLVLVGAVMVMIAASVWRDGQRQRVQRLRERFGPEYDIAVERHGERRARRVLEARERRVSKLPLRSLPPAERAQLSESWLLAQRGFADAPGKAVGDAHEIVLRTLNARGYQVHDFDQCLADLSVDYGSIVQHLRVAHVLVHANRAGSASTEELQQALVLYRGLLEGLLGTPCEQILPASQRYQPVLEHHHVSAPR